MKKKRWDNKKYNIIYKFINYYNKFWFEYLNFRLSFLLKITWKDF